MIKVATLNAENKTALLIIRSVARGTIVNLEIINPVKPKKINGKNGTSRNRRSLIKYKIKPL